VDYVRHHGFYVDPRLAHEVLTPRGRNAGWRSCRACIRYRPASLKGGVARRQGAEAGLKETASIHE
jgi:hypothetical protein